MSSRWERRSYFLGVMKFCLWDWLHLVLIGISGGRIQSKVICQAVNSQINLKFTTKILWDSFHDGSGKLLNDYQHFCEWKVVKKCGFQTSRRIDLSYIFGGLFVLSFDHTIDAQRLFCNSSSQNYFWWVQGTIWELEIESMLGKCKANILSPVHSDPVNKFKF